MKRKGIVLVSPQFLLDILKIKNAIILDIQMDHFRAGQIEIAVESPDMPEYNEGEYPLSVGLETLMSKKVG